jgi:hypothetical protein
MKYSLTLWFTALSCLGLLRAAESPAPAAKPDPLAPLRLLVGQWEGDSTGTPGVGKTQREYRFVLRGRYLELKNTSVYPPKEAGKSSETHEDVGLFSFDKAAKKIRFRQFHVEGFVCHYVEESISEDGRTLVFTAAAIENIAPGWCGRETYRLVGEDQLVETFELAEPGKDFTLYSEARLKRKK